jgi:cyclopropane fatty-acyl-phospholipid synthase-like methyltransferase
MPGDEFPTMWDFYNNYYRTTRSSKAYAVFCERVFGANFAQHGFSDMRQLTSLVVMLHLQPGDRVLDLGCGNGAIAEYIADTTGAHVTGIDNIPEAIRQARERRRGKENRLAFNVMDMAALDYPPGSFDTLVSIDSLYFSPIDETIRQMQRLLKPGSQMGIFYSHGVSPDNPIETFDLDSLHPDRTPLAAALRSCGLRYKAWDFTAEDYTHALLKKKVAEDLRAEFEAEGNRFLYDNRHGEAVGVVRAIDTNAHKRFMYHVTS